MVKKKKKEGAILALVRMATKLRYLPLFNYRENLIDCMSQVSIPTSKNCSRGIGLSEGHPFSRL
jgi:hypothetical protein